MTSLRCVFTFITQKQQSIRYPKTVLLAFRPKAQYRTWWQAFSLWHWNQMTSKSLRRATCPEFGERTIAQSFEGPFRFDIKMKVCQQLRCLAFLKMSNQTNISWNCFISMHFSTCFDMFDADSFATIHQMLGWELKEEEEDWPNF